jgi:hypothetical protein
LLRFCCFCRPVELNGLGGGGGYNRPCSLVVCWGNKHGTYLNTIESLAAPSPNAVKFKTKRPWKLQNKITVLLWFQAIYNTFSVLCLSSHRTTGINYANDMRPFLSDNIRRKTTGNWKIFPLHNMSSAVTWAGKGRGVSRKLYTRFTPKCKPAFRSAVLSSQKVLRMENYTSPFPSTVAKQRKATTCCQTCTIARSHEKNRLSVGRIIMNFILADFTKIWQEIHVWLKLDKINIHNPRRPGWCTTCNWLLTLPLILWLPVLPWLPRQPTFIVCYSYENASGSVRSADIFCFIYFKILNPQILYIRPVYRTSLAAGVVILYKRHKTEAFLTRKMWNAYATLSSGVENFITSNNETFLWSVSRLSSRGFRQNSGYRRPGPTDNVPLDPSGVVTSGILVSTE